jgi:hypothetical protein
MDFAFPPELSDALRRLYHLRRGPFLSPGPLQSIDDRAEMRSLFVRFPLEDCLNMMAPALWSSGDLNDALSHDGPSMEDVPPETLALWENVRTWVGAFVWMPLLYRSVAQTFSRAIHLFWSLETAHYCGGSFT